MLKQAWRSYITSLHPRNIRKAFDKGAIFPLIYWFVIYPLIMNAVSENMDYYNVMALMLMRMIPAIVLGWSAIGSKYLMPKAMYLSPMKKNERKEYIKNVLLIKIGMTIFLGICIEVLWGAFTGFHIGKMIIIILINLTIAIADLVSGEKKESNTFSKVMAILLMVAIAFVEVGTEGSLTVINNVFIAITVIILPIVNIMIIRKKYDATIALAGNYELAFKIEGKVEPQQVKFDLFANKE